MNCRHCHTPVSLPFIDLGTMPPSNAYLEQAPTGSQREPRFPLRVLVCEQCWLVQTEDVLSAQQLFSAEYAYFSSFSKSWLAHCERYAELMIDRLRLDTNSRVIEIAANDGYLLQYFRARAIPCAGVEPTAAAASAARRRGLDIIEQFFGAALGRELRATRGPADLLIANNVLAHVPDINDFVGGFRELMAPTGVATFEFPHLLRLRTQVQFDTIYHEHYSYLSLISVLSILGKQQLEVFDVEELLTHGGSLRLYVQHKDTGINPLSPRVTQILGHERDAGMDRCAFYTGFQDQVDRVSTSFREFLQRAHSQGLRIAAYGAAAKGNTLLNYAGIGTDLIPFVVDRNPAKQGRLLPGSRIPIVPEAHLATVRPDVIIILPWNLRSEIISQLSYTKEWGGQFVTAIPEITVQ